MKYDVITIGSATYDVFLTSGGIHTTNTELGRSECVAYGAKVEVEDLFFGIGGGAVNTAATFSSLQLTVAPVARIGDDVPGKYVLDQLQQQGISTEHIIIDNKEHTGYSTILMSSAGDRTVLVHRGASGKLVTTNIPVEQLDTKWLYITSLSCEIGFLEDLLTRAKRKKMQVAINPGVCELEKGLDALMSVLKDIDVFIVNSQEARLLTGVSSASVTETMKRIAHETPGIVVVTDGENGAYVSPAVSDEQKIYFAPAYETNPVNTTGAGDAFGSGFVAGLIHFDNDITRALQLASLNSGHVVREMGAQAGLLKNVPGKHVLDEVEVSIT